MARLSQGCRMWEKDAQMQGGGGHEETPVEKRAHLLPRGAGGASSCHINVHHRFLELCVEL